MKTLRLLISALSIVAGTPVLAQTDIAGTWTGMLAAAPGATLEVHFVLTRAGDGYTAVLKSPTQGAIPETPASSVTFADNRLVIAVDSLSGRYEGTLADGKFTGNWSQQGTAIPLELAPFAERVLSAEAKAALLGSWVGDLTVPQANVTLAIVLRFENNDAGEFVGFLDSPDQGARGIPLANIVLADGQLSVAVPQAAAEFTGALSGDRMEGTFNQLGQRTPLVLTKGEYRPRGAELSQEAIDRLKGSWVGRVSNAAGGSLAVVFRFESNGPGNVVAFLDSPEQGATNIPISELMLEGDQLSFVIPAAQANFRGTLSADAMTGTWAQGNASQELTMARGEYVPTVAILDLSAEAMQRLAGAWRGTMGQNPIMVRFENTADGPVASIEVPAGSGRRLPVTQASLTGDAVEFGMAAVGVTVAGTLAGDQITAQWRQGQQSTPLTLTRQP
jgi:hypothetical protein